MCRLLTDIMRYSSAFVTRRWSDTRTKISQIIKRKCYFLEMLEAVFIEMTISPTFVSEPTKLLNKTVSVELSEIV